MLAAIADAGLFDTGLVLVGTVAFQLYPNVIGFQLSSSALMTQDIDLSVLRFAAPGAVDVVTTPGRTTEPVLLKSLQCAAEPLAYTDYLIEDAFPVVALYGSGSLPPGRAARNGAR